MLFREKLFCSLLLAAAIAVFVPAAASAGAINASGADGIVVYSASASGTQPSYRNWTNSFANFSSAAAQSTHSNTILWTRVVGNFKRNEFLLGTLTSGTLRVHGRTFDGGAWGAAQSLTATAYTSSERDFDIAYEQVSGDGQTREFKTGGKPRFFLTPHCHSPGAVAAFDEKNKALFSSDSRPPQKRQTACARRRCRVAVRL